MIPFNYRFHGHNSLNFVYRKGQTVRTTTLTFKFLPNKFRSRSRAAVVVSKKISKSAVQRNRIRRRIYNIINVHIKQFKSPIDLVIIVNSLEINNLSYMELKTKIEQYLVAIKII